MNEVEQVMVIKLHVSPVIAQSIVRMFVVFPDYDFWIS
jgi:hypothetical protein